MTIDDVERLPGTGGDQYNSGADYTIRFAVYFSAGYDEAALRLNTDGRLPKKCWLMGAETGATASDTSVYADRIHISIDPESLFSAADTAAAKSGLAYYDVSYKQITPQFDPNPLLRVSVEWGGADLTEAASTDKDGNPLVNSAGEPYTSVPQRPLRGSSCVLHWNQAANPSAMILNYSNTSNSVVMWGSVAVGNGLLGQITASKTQEGTDIFWHCAAPFKLRRDGWKLKLIDNGFTFLDDDGNPQTPTDQTGQTKQTAVLLDGSGNVLAPGGTPVVFPSAGYDIYEATDWTAISGMPDPFSF